MQTIIRSKEFSVVRLYKLIAVLAAVATFAGTVRLPVSASLQEDIDVNAIYEQAVPYVDGDVWENGSLSMAVDASNGFVTVSDSRTGMLYASNPADYEHDTVAQGVNITRMISQLIVTYLDANKSVDEVNSFVGSVSENQMVLKKSGKHLIMEYTFPEQGFVIPLRLWLAENSLKAVIDYSRVQETGDCRILEIALLPFFGAARMNDKGYFILPDGSGSYVEFNNGKFAQGEYSREIYGGDLTKVSETKPNDYKPVILPVFASIYRYVTPPAEPSDTDEHKTTANGREVKAGFLAVIQKGAAGARITAAVAGGNTGYNTAGFTFLYRTYMETTLLSRTWAEFKHMMFSKERCMSASPEVEYVFLDQNQADIKGAADVYSNILLGKHERQSKLEGSLFLDIACSVRTQHQIFGIGYQDITPLTTLGQMDDMLEELKRDGVGNFTVVLRGLDSSGAYYGKIDTSIAVNKKLGTLTQLKDLTGKWRNVYPEVQLTQFTRNRLRYNSFFHSVTAVNRKTAKLFDYKYSTGMRDYSLPTRYLLSFTNVKKAATELMENAKNNQISHLAPLSLAQDLYSDFSGDTTQIGQMEEGVSEILSAMSKTNELILEKPNAYAIPSASKLLYIPHADSGHFISNGSIPFVQLVLDGIKEYSIPAMNYANDPRDLLLFAIESNSSLSFSLMNEDYSNVARTSMNRLYASNYEKWKETVVRFYGEWATARKQTASSPITNYEYINEKVRRVTFKNGQVVYVNYDTVPYQSGKIKVAAKSYLFTDAVSKEG